jgi:hypothetical protein
MRWLMGVLVGLMLFVPQAAQSARVPEQTVLHIAPRAYHFWSEGTCRKSGMLPTELIMGVQDVFAANGAFYIDFEMPSSFSKDIQSKLRVRSLPNSELRTLPEPQYLHDRLWTIVLPKGADYTPDRQYEVRDGHRKVIIQVDLDNKSLGSVWYHLFRFRRNDDDGPHEPFREI